MSNPYKKVTELSPEDAWNLGYVQGAIVAYERALQYPPGYVSEFLGALKQKLKVYEANNDND
jgi:hypothetical protein